MKNKFFGKNISPDCSYCENSFFEQGIVACSKSKHIKDGKCRAFSYDPLMRVPANLSLQGNYSAKDFML